MLRLTIHFYFFPPNGIIPTTAREGPSYSDGLPMIAFLKGILEARQESVCLVDVNGVGYEVHMPATDLDRLPAPGQPVVIHTWYHSREDGVQLFGFLDSADRALFKILLGISGVGPKSALAVLSGLSPADLEEAVARQDVDRLQRLPGIGRKTAERLLLELKDKMKVTAVFPVKSKSGEREEYGDALEALASLGYSHLQARQALQKIAEQEMPPRVAGQDRVAELVRLALRHL